MNLIMIHHFHSIILSFYLSFNIFFPFFTTEPYACEPSNLPKYPPTKELDIKLRDEEARRFNYSVIALDKF